MEDPALAIDQVNAYRQPAANVIFLHNVTGQISIFDRRTITEPFKPRLDPERLYRPAIDIKTGGECLVFDDLAFNAHLTQNCLNEAEITAGKNKLRTRRQGRTQNNLFLLHFNQDKIKTFRDISIDCATPLLAINRSRCQ